MVWVFLAPQRLQEKFGMILPGREHMGREQSFTNPLPSAPLPEKLRHLMKKKVFEAAFPLHEVRAARRCPGGEATGGGGDLGATGAASAPLWTRGRTELPAAAGELGWRLRLP